MQMVCRFSMMRLSRRIHLVVSSPQLGNKYKLDSPFKIFRFIIILRLHYVRVCRAFDSQSIAESSPSPFFADVLNIYGKES